MTDTRYKITMDGSIAPGVTLEFAQENFALLFKTDVSAVKRLFSGSATVLKRDVTEEEADKYIQVLFNTGVIAHKEVDLASNLSLELIDPDSKAESLLRMTCPKCGAEQAQDEMCASCGIVIAKFNSYQALAKQTMSTAKNSLSPDAPSTAEPEETDLNIENTGGHIGKMRRWFSRLR